jgi:hypothetical protein
MVCNTKQVLKTRVKSPRVILKHEENQEQKYQKEQIMYIVSPWTHTKLAGLRSMCIMSASWQTWCILRVFFPLRSFEKIAGDLVVTYEAYEATPQRLLLKQAR